MGLSIVALLGEAGPLADLADVAIRVPSRDTQLIQQVHLAVEHLILSSCRADAVSMTLTIAFVQLNPTVGDVAGNAALVRRMRDEAAAQGADLSWCFSELVLVGYPPEDLVLRPALVERGRRRAARSRARARRPARRDSWSRCRGERMAGCTTPWRSSRRDTPSCASSTSCPTTASSTRSASSNRARCPEPVVFRNARIGLPVCEDIWLDHVTTHLDERGVQLMLVPNGSPFEVDKFEHRLELARARRVGNLRLPLAVRQPGRWPGRAGLRRRILRR